MEQQGPEPSPPIVKRDPPHRTPFQFPTVKPNHSCIGFRSPLPLLNSPSYTQYITTHKSQLEKFHRRTAISTADEMSLPFGHTEFLLPLSPLHRRALPSRHHHRAWKRRRLKRLALYCHFNPTPSPFENLFQSLLSQFPSVNSINYIAPTLGFASGLALFFSANSQKLLPNPNAIENSGFDIGEWILFTSPTPFNRFVTLRCPSIYFPGNELLENVNEKLVKEDRHYVKLNSGRMI